MLIANTKMPAKRQPTLASSWEKQTDSNFRFMKNRYDGHAT
jgi:hypothetical protein